MLVYGVKSAPYFLRCLPIESKTKLLCLDRGRMLGFGNVLPGARLNVWASKLAAASQMPVSISTPRMCTEAVVRGKSIISRTACNVSLSKFGLDLQDAGTPKKPIKVYSTKCKNPVPYLESRILPRIRGQGKSSQASQRTPSFCLLTYVS